MKPSALLIALTLGALLPVPAVAQEGAGLYSPAPRKVGPERAERFVAELLSADAGRRVDEPPRPALASGIFQAGLKPPSAVGGATRRATADADWVPAAGWVLAVLALAGALALAAIRRPAGAAR